MKELQTLLPDFEASLDESIAAIHSLSYDEASLQGMLEKVQRFVPQALAVGDQAEVMLETEPEALHYILNFIWPEGLKSFLILWRDVLFQLQKAHILLAESQIEASQLEDLWERSQEVLEEAALSLRELLPHQLKFGLENPQEERRRRNRWALQKNPWPQYREQLQKIPQQCDQLCAQYQEALGCSRQFAEIQDLVLATIASCYEENEELKELAQKGIDFILSVVTPEEAIKPLNLNARLEELEEAIYLPDHLSLYVEAQEAATGKLPEKLRIPIETVGGLIYYREINLRRRVRQWMESKIRPVMMEIWEQTQYITNSAKMAVVNIRNRSLLLDSEIKATGSSSINKLDLSQPLESFLSKVSIWEANYEKSHALVVRRLQRDFQFTRLFDPTGDFLAIPLQTTLKQLNLNQAPLIAQVQAWTQNQQKRLQRFITRVEREENLSQSEKIVRVIQERSENRDNSNYSGIFLTKGYIGESFLVGRDPELKRMEALIENWRHGFRGSVLLKGPRFCGKTLFGEWVANRFFDEHVIRLRPNSTLDLQGRKLEVEADLEAALAFIRKHTLNQGQLVWIDDLEFWSDARHSLAQNVRALYKEMNKAGTNRFFLVSMSTWLRAHLDRFTDLGKGFQAEINLDRMNRDEVHQAILIRHGATHKALIDENSQEVSSAQFGKMVNAIYRYARGNIGEALANWSHFTRRVDEDQVLHRFYSGFQLPDFLTTENQLLLRFLMLNRRTNEYYLRQWFGPAFKEKYADQLQRLLSVGLLERGIDGTLEINEVIVNDLGRMLEQKKVLHFSER